MGGTDHALDPAPYRKFMRAVLAEAGADLVRPRPGGSGNPCWVRAQSRDWRRHRVSAACWLASKAATTYFDEAGYVQEDALRESGWPRVVQEILDEHESGAHRLEPEAARHLRRGLEALL